MKHIIILGDGLASEVIRGQDAPAICEDAIYGSVSPNGA